MKNKSYILLASTMALAVTLLPTTSQADVYWSISLGHSVQLHPDHYSHRSGHHGHKRHHVKRHRARKHHYAREHHYQPRRSYYGHRKHHVYHHHARHGAYPYAFIPRHRSSRW